MEAGQGTEELFALRRGRGGPRASALALPGSAPRVVGPLPQMKPIAVLLTVAFFLLLFAQFGARLPARRALLWTLAAALLVVTAWRPALFAPLVRSLGIELVSNFVLAAMVLF